MGKFKEEIEEIKTRDGNEIKYRIEILGKYSDNQPININDYSSKLNDKFFEDAGTAGIFHTGFPGAFRKAGTS